MHMFSTLNFQARYPFWQWTTAPQTPPRPNKPSPWITGFASNVAHLAVPAGSQSPQTYRFRGANCCRTIAQGVLSFAYVLAGRTAGRRAATDEKRGWWRAVRLQSPARRIKSWQLMSRPRHLTPVVHTSSSSSQAYNVTSGTLLLRPSCLSVIQPSAKFSLHLITSAGSVPSAFR